MQSNEDGHNTAPWILTGLNILKSKLQLSMDLFKMCGRRFSKSTQGVQLTCGAS